jgi:hypothetical protein
LIGLLSWRPLPDLQQANVQSCTIGGYEEIRQEKDRGSQVLIFQALRSGGQEKGRKREAGMTIAACSADLRLFFLEQALNATAKITATRCPACGWDAMEA